MSFVHVVPMVVDLCCDKTSSVIPCSGRRGGTRNVSDVVLLLKLILLVLNFVLMAWCY